MRAQKLQKRAARVGFDWTDSKDVMAKIREELQELENEMTPESASERVVEEAGDLLFSCVNLARKLDIDAEVALCRANDKFERRFRAVEERLDKMGQPFSETTLQKLDKLWEEIKNETPVSEQHPYRTEQISFTSPRQTGSSRSPVIAFFH